MFLSGARLYLRPVAEDDLNPTYLGWLNDPDVTRYLTVGRLPVSAAQLREYWSRFQTGNSNLLFAIVDRTADRHVGNVTLNNIDWINRTADTGLMLGEKTVWGRGYAAEAWSLLLAYAFHRLNLRRIVAGVVDGNEASLKTLRKLGFEVEGKGRAEYLLDGAYRDVWRLGVLREEFDAAAGRRA